MRFLCAAVLIGHMVGWSEVGVSQLVSLNASADEAVVQAIVKKALPPIVAGANEWMADNDCVSCHRVTHAAWALNLAAARFDIEADSAVTDQHRQQINTWSTDWTKVANPKVRAAAQQATTLQNDADTVGQAILGVAVVQDSLTADWAKVYHKSLIEGQQEAGFWKAGGQLPLQKRPVAETNEVTTMWSIVALNASPKPSPEEDIVRGKTSVWLESKDRISSGKSTEWWALKSLLSDSDGAGGKTDLATTKLLSFQNSDGGWGWLVDEDSDALGTGIALYALAYQPAAVVAESRGQAVEFLRTTQLADGTWDVKGTKKSGRNEVVETASYWGTCWAVIGLLQ